jgi:hypothetical protein
MRKFKIRKFNPAILEKRRLEFGHTPTVLALGPRNTGKSTLTKDLLFHIKDIPMFVCMSGTEGGNGFYSKFMHHLMIHKGFRKDIINNIISHQEEKLGKVIDAGYDPKKVPALDVGLLLDDCGFEPKNLRSEELRYIFMNGRHMKIAMFACLQYVMGFPPDIRSNIDYLFVMRNNNYTELKKIYDNFFGCFKRFDEFLEVFRECTDGYGCLVLDKTSKSYKLEECVFYYEAVPNRNYQMCPRSTWAYLDDRYDKTREQTEKDDVIDKPSRIIVKKQKAD